MNVNPMTPLTTIRVCVNVPLDVSYKDTIDFPSTTAQLAYFNSKVKHTFRNLTPVRFQNKIRLPVNADDLYDCNYVMFQNANFESRWFYAFIKKIDFINVNMSEIEIELDVIQSWWFSINIKPSFVVREHINDDSIGNNITHEGLECGEYVLSSHTKAGVSNNPTIVVASTVDKDANPVEGGYYGGTYSGAKLLKLTANEANTFITSLTGLNMSSAIVSVFMASRDFIGELNSPPPTKEISLIKRYNNIDGYYPKNNKLFIYPYNYLYCNNTNGNTADFRYEFFNDNTCTFGLIGDSSCNPQVTLIPKNYKIEGLGNLNEKMVLSGFPQCAYNIDSYSAWLAQNGASTAIGVIGSATALVAGAVVSGGLGAVAAVGGVAGIANTMAQVTANSAKPPQANGSSGASNTFAYGQLDFHFYGAQITAKYARQIDDFFSMFGYATNLVKNPNINGRPSWNYVKTIDCKIVGTVPFDDIVKIRNAFDNGITFWHGDWVGDYSRNNG